MLPSLLCAVAMMSDNGMLRRRRSLASTGDRKSTWRFTPPALKVKIDCVAVVCTETSVMLFAIFGTAGAPRNRNGWLSIMAMPVIALTRPFQYSGQVPGAIPVLPCSHVFT